MYVCLLFLLIYKLLGYATYIYEKKIINKMK